MGIKELIDKYLGVDEMQIKKPKKEKKDRPVNVSDRVKGKKIPDRKLRHRL